MRNPRIALVADCYDRIADRFAEWRERIDADPRREWAAELHSRLPEGVRVLELGCGAGGLETHELARRFRLTGVDVSLALHAFGASDLPGWIGEWLGAPTFFSSYEPSENRQLVQAAGLAIVRDEVVTILEPEGPVQFHWILAER
jgi:SAM-dependent methyltransferase